MRPLAALVPARVLGSAARALVVLLVAGGMVLVSPSAALACSCVQLTAEQHAKDADTVAIGTVQWVADNGIEKSYSVSFTEVYKGMAGLQEKIVTASDEASCGLADLAVDKKYIFFLEGKHPGRMRANLCGGTTAYDVATLDAVESVAGPPKEPFPSFASGPEASGTDPVRVIGIGALVLAGVVAIVLVLRRRAQGHGGRQYLG